jgi:hypothetical protein
VQAVRELNALPTRFTNVNTYFAIGNGGEVFHSTSQWRTSGVILPESTWIEEASQDQRFVCSGTQTTSVLAVHLSSNRLGVATTRGFSIINVSKLQIRALTSFKRVI